MNRITYLALPTLALAGALVLTACGDGSDTAGTGSPSSEHGGGHSGGSSDDASAKANETDISFLTGMTPHHEQAVEMSDMVLAANPPAPVATIAQKIKGAQSPEIEQMKAMLADLGEPTDGGAHDGHSSGHGGMMSDADMAALDAATGEETARLYLEGMIKHHQGAIEASDTEIAGGKYAPAIELAKQIKQAQAVEITEMERLLQTL